MQQIGQTSPPVTGGRTTASKFRLTDQEATEFNGLPEGVTRYDLLRLVKHVGHEFGFNKSMIQLLEYYLVYTKDQDWEKDSRPIMYQSLIKTALHFDMSERNIQLLEDALFKVGALTWNDSGNYRRNGQRDKKTGKLQYAYGVDLSPLAALHTKLQQKLDEKELREKTWMEEKRRISGLRAQIRKLLDECVRREVPPAQLAAVMDIYNEITVTIRAYMTLEDLLSRRRQHEGLHEQVKALLVAPVCQEEATQADCGLTENNSSMDEKNFVHIHTTNQISSNKLDTSSPTDTGLQRGVMRPPVIIGKSESQVEPEKPSGSETASKYGDFTWQQLLNASSERFKFYLQQSHRKHRGSMNMADIVSAAASIRSDLGVSRSAWADACSALGRDGAAICLLIIDQKSEDKEDPVLNAGGYLRGMVKKAKEDKLNLHGSVFGLLKKGEGELDA